MTAAGQTINDRILAARHSIAGQGLAKAVCKATTEEIIGPKKKHLDYLLHCTNEPNVSIPTLANQLIERTQNPNWVVVFKGLITTHHLMCYGNERFTQYLASSNSNFQLSNFLDKSGVQGYDMSPFIRRYAKYLSEKSVSYRTVAFDFCKVKRGRDGGTLRTMNPDKLLKTLPVLQQQLDALVEFDCTSQDLNNGVINACFMLLFRDLIRLFACYNDGIINLLEKYFDMNKKQARDALDLYKKFLIRMDRVADFLKVAENVGIEKSDIPDLAKAPSSLLEALEAHLAALEGRKPGSGGTTPTGNNRVNVAAAVSALASTSNSFGTAVANNAAIDERTAQKLLEEEAAAMEKFRSTAGASNPFAAAADSEPEKEETPNILDLFGVAAPVPSAAAPAAATAGSNLFSAAPANNDGKASDDLLQLAGNPFANMLNAAGNGVSAFPPSPAAPSFMSPMTAGYGGAGVAGVAYSTYTSSSSHSTTVTNSGPFVSDFGSVFGQNSGNGLTGDANLFGEVMQPANKAGGANSSQPNPKVITGDLDASLANLASNLNFGSAKKGGVVGGAGARGPPMAPSPAFNAFQQQQPMVLPNSSGNFNSPYGPTGQSSPFGVTGSPFPSASNSGMAPPSISPLTPALVSSQSFPALNSPFPGNNAGSGQMLSPSPAFPAANSAGYSGMGMRMSSSMYAGISPTQAFNNNNNNNEFGSKSPFAHNPNPAPLIASNNSTNNDPFGLL